MDLLERWGNESKLWANLKIYSDYEPGMEQSIEFPKWLEEHNILHIVTRSHANTAERAIRTFKDLLTRRIESKEIEPGEVCYNDNILYAIRLKYNLIKNGKSKHRSNAK